MSQILKFLFILSFCGTSCRNHTHFDVLPEKVDFCNYFSLEMPKYDSLGKVKAAPYPVIKPVKNTPGASFINKHHWRFQYIIFNHIDSIWYKLYGLAKLRLDSLELNRKYCAMLNDDKMFRNYFNVLAYPATKNSIKYSFTEKEMMLVASQFFMWDSVNHKDTNLIGHICIGINGQKELKTEKDLAVLEAFCYEAIFDNIRKAATNFNKYGTQVAKKERKAFTDFSTFLESVKTGTYSLMENDDLLKGVLIKHYKKNRGNLGFVLTSRKSLSQ